VKLVGTAEGLGGEPGQVLDVVGLALPEQRLQQWIGENLRVEEVFESVQAGVAAGVLVQARHPGDATGTSPRP
jgi:hypothetical protein